MALTGDVYEKKPTALTEAALEKHDKKVKNDESTNNGDGEGASNGEADNCRSQVGAGLLAGITGLCLGGPVVGAITGAGAYYVAANDDGAAGQAARNTGDWAVSTGTKVADAAKEADKQHNIFERVNEFFSNGWNKVCQFNEEHKATERVKETVSDVGAKTIEFERNHHVVANILEGIKNGIDFLLEKLKGATGNDNSNTQSG
jgi:hypothetical protein